MAFIDHGLTKLSNLSPQANPAVAPLPGLFFYNAGADNLATVVAAGYFNTARDQFQPNSVIIALASDGFRLLKVTVPALAADNVTVAAVLGAVS